MDLVYLAGIALFFVLIAGLIVGCYTLGVPTGSKEQRS